MRPAHRIAMIQVIVLSASLSATRAESEFDQKAAQYFAVKCASVTYSKTANLEDSKASPKQVVTSENLSLFGKIEIRDPNLVLATSSWGVITQVTAANGRDIEIAAPPMSSGHMYEVLRYQERMVPPSEPSFRRLVRSALRLPMEAQFQSHWVVELQPSQMNCNFNPQPLGQAGGELPRVKGYFCALVAESVKYVDVPFEPNNAWVRLTPDREVRVRAASQNGPFGNFNLEVRPQDTNWRPLQLGDPLPDRLVVGLQFLSEDGTVTPAPRQEPWLPMRLHGGSARVSQGQIKTMRFVVAIHPTHRQIPFEFQHIPLPNEGQPKGTPTEGR